MKKFEAPSIEIIDLNEEVLTGSTESGYPDFDPSAD